MTAVVGIGRLIAHGRSSYIREAGATLLGSACKQQPAPQPRNLAHVGCRRHVASVDYEPARRGEASSSRGNSSRGTRRQSWRRQCASKRTAVERSRWLRCARMWHPPCAAWLSTGSCSSSARCYVSCARMSSNATRCA